jgi:hypothetical protein
MPRDRPRQLPDQTGSLGAVHPRPPPPRGLRPHLRSRLEGAPLPGATGRRRHPGPLVQRRQPVLDDRSAAV